MRKLFVVLGIVAVLAIGSITYVLTAGNSGSCCGDPCEPEQGQCDM